MISGGFKSQLHDHDMPALAGPNSVVSVCLDFSYAAAFLRRQADNGTALIVDMQNYPCR